MSQSVTSSKSQEVVGPSSQDIGSILKGLTNDKYLIPEIQRDYVWTETLVQDFFDSLMKKYFVGAMIFWSIKDADTSANLLYRRITQNVETDETDDKKFESISLETVRNQDKTFVFDGQQRLTALYAGISEDLSSEQGGVLYLNLLSGPSDSTDESRFQFKFSRKKMKNGKSRSGIEYWAKMQIFLKEDNEDEIFKVTEDALKWIKRFSEIEDKEESRHKILESISKAKEIKRLNITYWTIKSNIFSAIEMFGRINNSGKKIEGWQLMLCFFWGHHPEMRNESIGLVDDLKVKYGWEKADSVKSIIMRLAYYLSDFSIKFDSKSLARVGIRESLDKIEESWSDIKKSLEFTIDFLYEIGFLLNIQSTSVIVSLAYFFHHCQYDENSFAKLKRSKNKENENWQRMKDWTSITIYLKTLSNASNSTLNSIRNVIKNNVEPTTSAKFPNKLLFEKLKQKVDRNEIDAMIKLNPTKQRMRTLSLFLFLQNVSFKKGMFYDLDHIYPKSKMLGNRFDSLANIQPLPEHENRKKSDADFSDWYESYNRQKNKKKYREEHFIPYLSNYNNEICETFIEERAKLIREAIEKKSKAIGLWAEG